MPHFRSIAGWIAVVVVTVMLAATLYMGTYYAMLRTAVIDSDGTVLPIYRIDGNLVSKALHPAHQVDKQLRPYYWTVDGWFDRVGITREG